MPKALQLVVAFILMLPAGTSAQMDIDNRVASERTFATPERGPLVLAVEDAVALALANNPELLAERQNPIIAGAFEQVERARFDPVAFGSVSRTREITQQQFANTSENLDIENERDSARLGLRQNIPTGTQLELMLSQDRSESNRAPTQAGSRVGLNITQALLRGAGIATNLVALRQARTDVAASAYQLRGFVSQLVADVERIYWDYVGAREAIRILEASLDLAERQVDATSTRIEVGALPRTELAAVRAEAARRQQELIDGRARAEQLRTDLLQRLHPGGVDDWARAIEATSGIPIAPESLPVVDDHVTLARERRAELNEARLRRVRNELEVVATRNGLLPRLDLFVTLGQTGFADSFGDAWSRVDDGDTYDLTAGVEFELPLGNRAARGDDLRARTQLRQVDASLANLERLVVGDVRRAVLEVERSAAQIDATAATLTLQEQALEAEQARFEVGRSTSLLVAQAQRDLLQAQLDRANAFIAFRQARIALYRLDGTLLTRRLIAAPGEAPPVGTPY